MCTDRKIITNGVIDYKEIIRLYKIRKLLIELSNILPCNDFKNAVLTELQKEEYQVNVEEYQFEMDTFICKHCNNTLPVSKAKTVADMTNKHGYRRYDVCVDCYSYVTTASYLKNKIYKQSESEYWVLHNIEDPTWDDRRNLENHIENIITEDHFTYYQMICKVSNKIKQFKINQNDAS